MTDPNPQSKHYAPELALIALAATHESVNLDDTEELDNFGEKEQEIEKLQKLFDRVPYPSNVICR